jgi:hypothetical protein
VPIIKFLVADGWQITGQTIFANGGYTLQKAITRTHGMESPLARALGNDPGSARRAGVKASLTPNEAVVGCR